MFGLSGVDGEFFRGSLEQMLRTHRVGASRATRGIEREEGEPHTVVEPHDDHHYQAAATAYAASLKASPERGPVYHAYQVMSRRVVTLTPATGIEAAWRTLVAKDVGQAPVLTADGGLVGLVSRWHLLNVLNEADGRISAVRARPVSEVMLTPVISVEPVVDVRRVAEVLLAYDLPAMPVVDAEARALVGIVSRSDLLRCMVLDPPLTLWA